MSKQTVLITGCSDGGLGAALAVAFQNAGFKVIASARRASRMQEMQKRGIDVLELDVTSDASVQEAYQQIEKAHGGKLDVLVNNAGAGYSMPILDLDLNEVSKLFDLNVFSLVRMTKAFFPLLRRSAHPLVVNNTSIAGVYSLPLQATYNATKSAASAFTSAMRLELEPFGVRVVDLRTGSVQSNFFVNSTKEPALATLPPQSLYQPGKDKIERFMGGEGLVDGTDAAVWAKQIVETVTRPSPPKLVWSGKSSFLIRLSQVLPSWIFDSVARQMTGMDELKRKLQRTKGE